MATLLEQCEQLLFQVGDERRWIQDSPVHPNVWRAFANAPKARIDLLITPHRTSRPAALAAVIRAALARSPPGEAAAEVAFNQSLVVARVLFDELIQRLVPLSAWFQTRIGKHLDDVRKIVQGTGKQAATKLRRLLAEIKNPQERAGDLPALVVWWLRVTGEVSLRLERGDNRQPLPEDTLERALALLNLDQPPPQGARLFRIALNRTAKIAAGAAPAAICMDSVRTIKADAARRLFEVDTSRICWAVLDSGIDATHPAFDDNGKSRVTQSYDFTRIRRLMVLASTPGDEAEATLRSEFGVTAEQTRRLRGSLLAGYDIDWEQFRPALEVKHAAPSTKAYFQALHPHGTHVAGILGGNPARIEDLESDFSGVCPDIRLIDIRILDQEGQSKDGRPREHEFDTVAALQFVGHLNSFADDPVVHGVNLSIQLQHDPTDSACGRTPVCEECNKLVASGVVVVAAAGNMGIDPSTSTANTTEGAFRDISIADPGNAEAVITVGSTHRKRPHSYGISFFSSRGPTGDGRAKPDLVAPGEKILGPIPGSGYEEMQGTSQAAPHVSGAAAMLLAQFTELIGDPRRVKEILCKSATDLGRVRDFQGAGLLDVLRAMQSV